MAAKTHYRLTNQNCWSDVDLPACLKLRSENLIEVRSSLNGLKAENERFGFRGSEFTWFPFQNRLWHHFQYLFFFFFFFWQTKSKHQFKAWMKFEWLTKSDTRGGRAWKERRDTLCGIGLSGTCSSEIKVAWGLKAKHPSFSLASWLISCSKISKSFPLGESQRDSPPT